MNNSGNHRNLEHAINILRNPAKARESQTELNKKRLARVEKSIGIRPVYIPFEFVLGAASQVSPYQDITPSLPYDVVISGLMSDNSARQLVIRESFRDLPFVLAGENRNLYLNLGDLAGGTSAAAKGQKGIFYLPSPIVLEAGNRLNLDVYKTETTPDPETINFVLVGYRVSKNYQLDDAERKLVLDSIAKRSLPRTIWLKQQIDFDSAIVGGKARNVYTPQCDEPLLIRGCRSSLRQSLIDLGIEGEAVWTTNDCPIWAIVGDDEDESDSYMWFQRPIFLPSRETLEMSLTNSIDGVNIDPQLANQITWICETV
jgi:hypothetical protein